MPTVFLDLEMTVLDDFTKGFDALPMNIEIVSSFLRQHQVTDVHLFSFALCNREDVDDFKFYHRRWLEGLLGVRFNMQDVFTTQELYELCARQHLAFDSVAECSRYYGKQFGFEQYLRLRGHLQGQQIVLIDDLVTTETVTIPELASVVQFLNVGNLAALSNVYLK